MKTIRIEVTQDDIEQGERGSPDCCPVALAIKRISTDNDEPSVDGEIAWFLDPESGEEVSGYLPEEAVRFIDRFDERLPVEPFSFDLDLELEEE